MADGGSRRRRGTGRRLPGQRVRACRRDPLRAPGPALIFVDTSFWFAVRTRRDQHHQQARALLERHGDRRLVTSNHVSGETWTLLRSRNGHEAAVHFFDMLEASRRVRVVHVSEEAEADARTWLRQREERPYSFVDATSFALMRQLGVGEALTFDRDFQAAGFHVPT